MAIGSLLSIYGYAVPCCLEESEISSWTSTQTLRALKIPSAECGGRMDNCGEENLGWLHIRSAVPEVFTHTEWKQIWPKAARVEKL